MVYKTLNNECKMLNLAYNNDEIDELFVFCFLAKISFADKFNMITKKEANSLREKAYLLMK